MNEQLRHKLHSFLVDRIQLEQIGARRETWFRGEGERAPSKFLYLSERLERLREPDSLADLRIRSMRRHESLLQPSGGFLQAAIAHAAGAGVPLPDPHWI